MKNKLVSFFLLSVLLFSAFPVGYSQAKNANTKAIIKHLGSGTEFDLKVKEKHTDLGGGKYITEYVTAIPEEFFTDWHLEICVYEGSCG